ncbi:AAA family ATPase [Marinobacter salarius]|uniref:AAA family ATPase n=1 Tax=Marinobacter salarius TaxID=1420917 RepID=UPI00241EA1A9|nr:AAA family ATPase [Marinobacter salarius]
MTGRVSGVAGRRAMNRRFVVTGGPGGGKSTLLDALAERGYRIAPEAARHLIKERLAAGLSPRPDPVSFARAILDSDMQQYSAATDHDGITFFDRGVLDALYMLDLESGLWRDEIARLVQTFPYNDTVFLLPPWEAIYAMDSERDQTFEESVAVFEGMKRWYARWGYQTVEVPRAGVAARASFILEAIGHPGV